MTTRSFRILFREHLRSAGYTQEEFAGLLNVTPGALSKWINGHNPWPDDAFSKTYTLLALDENQQAEFYELVTAMREDRFVSIDVDGRSTFSESRESIASHPPLQSPSHTEHSEREAASTTAQTQPTEIEGAPVVAGAPAEAGGNVETDPWRSQVRQELAILQRNVPQTNSEVAAVIAGVVKVGQVLTAQHNIQLKVDPIPKNLTAVIQPSALRQIILTAIEKLVQHMTSGEIVLLAEMAGEFITLTVTGGPIVTDTLPDSALIQELLGDQGDTFNIRRAGETIVFQFRLSATGDPISVLVVDDNADLMTFFQVYVTNTRYQIIHLADGERLFETIAATKPNLIVLDVLLPGMDGWELLAYLHEHPDTRAIPIIVCSVIRREDLALALGASLYLPKPVRRQQFIGALDEVCGRVVA